jgi:Tol biopolymer transport system component
MNYGYKLMIAILACASITQPVQAFTPETHNGRIVFTRSDQFKKSIWMVDQNGSHERLLATDAQSPVWSPDGRKLAYIMQGRLYIMKQDGSHQRRLAWIPGYIETSPVWASDNETIAFTRHELFGQKRSAVFTIQSSGYLLRNVSGWSQTHSFRSPSWAPDCQRLVYERFTKNDSSLLIKNLKTNKSYELTSIESGTIAQPRWSPNGKKILFNESPGQVYTIWPDGSHRTVISDGDSYFGDWSPDGESIVFVEGLHEATLSVSEADGTVRQLSIQRTSEELGPPLWSPNGSKILWMARQQDGSFTLFAANITSLMQAQQLAINTTANADWQANRR